MPDVDYDNGFQLESGGICDVELAHDDKIDCWILTDGEVQNWAQNCDASHDDHLPVGIRIWDDDLDEGTINLRMSLESLHSLHSAIKQALKAKLQNDCAELQESS